jgi:hypothetical protein
VEGDFAAGVHDAIEDQISAGALVQRVDGVVRVRDQHRQSTVEGVVAPGGVGGVDHRLGVTAGDAVVFGVGVDGFGAAMAEIEGGGLLPLVDEPVHVDQFGGVIGGRGRGGRTHHRR